MKSIGVLSLYGLLAAGLFTTLAGSPEVRPLQSDDLAGHRLPAGTATEVLPQHVLLHLQFNGLMPVIEGLEGILKAAVPQRVLPPEVQPLLQSPHPLLTLIGIQHFGGPLDEEQFAAQTGLALRQPATLSLFAGDPRRMFIVSLPIANAGSLANVLTGLIQPREIERIQLGSGMALRLVPREGPIPELYLTCSADRAYLCGDRALALALHALPPAERMSGDGFLTRALKETAGQHVAAICDPRMIKPLVLQLAQLQPIGMMLLKQQKQELLTQLPREARAQMEQQFRAQFGVENLEQFAAYLEVMLDVTSRQLLDYVTNELLSFEGLCFTARLDARFPELGLRIYSQSYQPSTSTSALPMSDIRGALQWVGSDYSAITATGRQPAPVVNAGLRKWVTAVREEFARQGLASSWFEHFATLLDETRAVEPMESRAPWVLTVNAPVEPQPDLAKAESLAGYFKALRLPARRAVKIVPGANLAFLERGLESEIAVLNRNRELAVEFNRQTTRQEPWFEHLNRLAVFDVDSGIRRFVMESAWQTHGGLFGYDQHELVNRRWFFARQVDGYLVYHQGGTQPVWLRNLGSGQSHPLSPAVGKLLEQVPADANAFAIRRSLQVLPQLVDWLAALEARAHQDLEAYLNRARKAASEATSPEEAKARISRLPMPELLYSLNRRPDSGELYLTLPGNLTFPRARLVPFLQEVLAGYARGAAEVGGSLSYSRVAPGVYQVSLLQSTEAFALLTSSVGNAIAETYLSSPDGLQRLQRAVQQPGDLNPESFDQILVANPMWNFIPRPAPKTEARPVRAVPERSSDAGADLIDLSRYYNGLLDDTWQAGGMANNSLAGLPKGVQELGGIPFDIRGVVQLSGRSALEQLSVRFPKSVEGIAVGRKAAKLAFLHACGWPAQDGTVIGKFIVHYDNGEAREIPIVYGEDVLDWWTATDGHSAPRVAWSGPNAANPNGPPKSIYLTVWVNPLPDIAVRSVDYVSAMSDAAPFLIALTAR